MRKRSRKGKEEMAKKKFAAVEFGIFTGIVALAMAVSEIFKKMGHADDEPAGGEEEYRGALRALLEAYRPEFKRIIEKTIQSTSLGFYESDEDYWFEICRVAQEESWNSVKELMEKTKKGSETHPYGLRKLRETIDEMISEMIDSDYRSHSVS